MSKSLVESFDVLTTLAAQRIVAAGTTTANTVVFPANAADLPVGVTADTVRDTVSAIPVQVNGIAKVLFNDTVSSGNLVAADSSGRGIPFTAATVSAAYVGTLVGPSVAATGTIADVLIRPGKDSTG